MIKNASSTASQHRPFLLILPLIIDQHRPRSLDNAAPTSSHRRRHAELNPNADGARSTRPRDPSNGSAFVVPISRNRTLALLKSP